MMGISLLKLIIVFAGVVLIRATPVWATPSLCTVMMEVEKAPPVQYFRQVNDDDRLRHLTRLLYQTPGVALNGRDAQKNKDPELVELIEWVSGVQGGSLAKLYYYVRVTRDIPWLDWLNQSGLDGYRISGRIDEAISDAEIVKAIQAVSAAGRSISQKDFATDRSEESRQVIEAAIGKAVTPSVILTRAEKHDGEKGTWPWWLKQAGFEPEQVQRRRSTLPADRLNDILLSLESSGVDLNSGAVSENRSEQVAQFIFAETGHSLTPSQIHTWVTQSLQLPWIPTLQAAGVDLSKIEYRTTGITEADIVLLIQAMDRLQINLSPRKLDENNSTESALAIYRESGFFISPANVYRLARSKFDIGWWEFLERAGLNPSLIFQHGWLTGELIVQAIEAMERAGMALNVNSVYFYSEAELVGPLEFLGRPVSGRAILYRAGLTLGSWDLALVEAGLNPDDVRKQGWADLSILSEAQLQQRRQVLGRQQSLERRTVVERNSTTDQMETVVADDTGVEEAMISHSVSEYMAQLGSKLEEDELELFEFFLEAVVKLSEESGNWGIQQVIMKVQLIHPEVAIEKIQALILKISEESELSKILGGS